MSRRKPPRSRKRKRDPDTTTGPQALRLLERPIPIRRQAPAPLVAYLPSESRFVNLSGDYSYLTSGYYRSLDLECAATPCSPTCIEALDAYIVPLFLEKAKLSGLPVSGYYMTNEYFDPPVILDTVNPFNARQSMVLKEGHRDRVAASMTRNFTYAVCCQELPEGGRVGRFRQLLGWTSAPQYRPLASAVWETFRVPLGVVRVIVKPDGDVLLSGMAPLPFHKLTPAELAHVQKVVRWPT